MKVSCPVAVTLPKYGVLFAESVHSADFQMPERRDPFHKVLYVLAGRVIYRESSSELELRADTGTILVVPHGVQHVITDLVPSTLLLLCMNDDFLQRDPDLPELWLGIVERGRRGLRPSRPSRLGLEGMWRRAMLEKALDRVGGGVSVRTLATQCVLQLARLPASASEDDALQRTAAVSREMEETFFEEWSLDRAAARAGLSRRRFSELFRHREGVTFGARLTELRLAHAAELLRQGEHSTIPIMFSCGFNDLSHFYRLFRQRFGAAPVTWARSHAAAAQVRSAPTILSA